MATRVALIGCNGQLAQDIQGVWSREAPDTEIVGLRHADVEVTDPASVSSVLDSVRPDLVINTSASHKVDVLEEDPYPAFAVNALGARHVAQTSARVGATLVFISTDYVYSGEKGVAYTEADPVDPINVYGASKVAGETLVRLAGPRHFIVRASGLYGLAGSSGKGGNFVELMLRLAREGKPIRVVRDQRLTPTPTEALARQILTLWRTGSHGTYHATCQGDCTWFEFAQELFRQTGVTANLAPQSTRESGARARRPACSVLDNAALRRLGVDRLPSWQDGLAAYLASRPTA